MTSPPDPQRLARAALTALAEPACPVLGALLRLASPAQIIGFVHAGVIPSGVAAELEIPGEDAAHALARWQSRLSQAPDAADLARYEQQGIRLLCPGDHGWPSAVDDLDVPPYALWLRGGTGLNICSGRSVAVVGSRAATGYGAYVAGQIAADLAEHGRVIVSGGAYGIDTAAHNGALTAGGLTIAVLASGADYPYPAGNAGVLDRIAASGSIVSELPPGSRPTRRRFLHRNRIIAALSGGTVIVEAGKHSGALNTARHAASLGRPLMAVPGPVTSAQSAGANGLIRDRAAACITDAADILQVIGQPAWISMTLAGQGQAR